MKNQKIPTGQVLGTFLINTQMELNPYFNKFIQMCLKKHIDADFSGCCDEDANSNREALKDGNRILNVFHIPNAILKSEDKIWIITEADRKVTTILFPNEY